jgi:DNA transposition AAA+ family ATPase
MDTTALQLAKRAINDLVEFSAMGVIHGPAGTGKTFAWRTAVAELDLPVCAVQFPSRPSMLRIAQVLLRELSGQLPRGSRFTLSDALLDILSDRSRLLVIDEAQWLNRDCVEFIRHLHYDPKTQLGLALVGGRRLLADPLPRSDAPLAPLSPRDVRTARLGLGAARDSAVSSPLR